MPLFGTLIALADEKKGAVIAGMIDMPALAERWYGTPNGTTFNEEPARVSRAVNLADAQIYTSSPDFFSPEDWARYDTLSRKAMFRRFGGDCYQYGLLASGHCDLVVEILAQVVRLHGTGAGGRGCRGSDMRLGRPAAHPPFRRTGDRGRQHCPAPAGPGNPQAIAGTLAARERV